jgi:hypothetical protein
MASKAAAGDVEALTLVAQPCAASGAHKAVVCANEETPGCEAGGPSLYRVPCAQEI